MKCPSCGAANTRVYETRTREAYIERVRMCHCGARWLSFERPQLSTLTTAAPLISTPPVPHPYPTGTPLIPQAISDSSPRSLSERSGSDPLTPEFSKQNSGEINTCGAVDGGGLPVVMPRPNLFTVVLGQFCEAWGKFYRKPYRPTAADRNQLGRALNDVPAEELQDAPEIFARYLADCTPWVAQNHRHSLCFFCTSGGFNKYRVEVLIRSEKEARGRMAGEQWLRMHEEEADNARKR